MIELKEYIGFKPKQVKDATIKKPSTKADKTKTNKSSKKTK